jgi:hypothetical protein
MSREFVYRLNVYDTYSTIALKSGPEIKMDKWFAEELMQALHRGYHLAVRYTKEGLPNVYFEHRTTLHGRYKVYYKNLAMCAVFGLEIIYKNMSVRGLIYKNGDRLDLRRENLVI